MIIADDTGISDSDNITSVRNPEFQFLKSDASADSIELYELIQVALLPDK